MTTRIWQMAGALLVLCAAVLVIAVVVVGRKRRSAYRYDVRQDSRYDFARSRATRLAAKIRNGCLEVPARRNAQDTVLLEVRIRSTVLGKWFEPHVLIESGSARLTQAFERGGVGLRYINLSPLDLQSPTLVKLRGKFLQIRDQDVTLDYLPNELNVERQRILVVSPHPDDAEIAAYGLYEDRDAYVITVTAGDAGDAGPFSMFAGREAFLQKGRVRAWNSLTVPMLAGLGTERTGNLGYFDGTLSRMKDNPAQPVHAPKSGADSLEVYRRAQSPDLLAALTDTRATWANLVRDFEHLIKHLEPDVIVTPTPAAQLDEHPDHQCTTIALIQAIRNLQWTRGALLLYSNHSPVSPRYPYGDAGDLVSLPPTTAMPFDGIWSQTLTRDQQARKYLALDAMIDVRPDLKPASLLSVAALFKRALTSSATDSHDSYYRRAVRANELFFVLRVASLYEPGIME